MKSLIIKKAIALSCVIPFILATGCSDEKRVEPQTKLITTNAQMSAEELALAAEQIIGPYTFMLAEPVLNQALEKDPTNKRAQLYKAFIKPFMLFKGILTRIEGVTKEIGTHENLKGSIDVYPDSPYKSFLLSAAPPINSDIEAQAFLASVRNAFNDFRLFLKQNPDLQFDINLNPHLFEDTIQKRWTNVCSVVNTDPDNYEVECDTRMVMKVGMNAADIMAVQQYAAGMVVYLTPFTSHNLTGLKSVLRENEEAKKNRQQKLRASEVEIFQKVVDGEIMKQQPRDVLHEVS